ncbi:complement factor H-like isoform X2 [Trichomycterus rosablanca]|uniref:complement factor H-like isoform X2 n=1 Tax=Trichomycterus rosablanca TaxID=2290929 RepID=UPI002F35D1C6
MHVAVEFLIFTLWVFSFTLAQNQECLRTEINYKNTQKSDLLESYEHGQTVRLNCATGYTGFYKLRCENGKWTKIVGRDCKKKNCGHPGDTTNGNFRLIRGTEFVFGSTVEYSCKKGYVMASRVNTRNCQADGWDNAVPLCEVVKCPEISTDNVIARGNTEEPRFGDVIQFECASPSQMLDNTEEIHCDETGVWSAPVPKCKEVECQPPDLPHGTISNPKPAYKLNEVLKYTCDSFYKLKAGIIQCTKYGWSIYPECQEITCALGPTTYGTEKTIPIGKNIFKALEFVEIICLKNYLVGGTKKRSQMIRCEENGEWKIPPKCAVITCDVPYDKHVYSPDYYFTKRRLDDSNYYYCHNGFSKTAEKATCTENGWSPQELCTEIVCKAPVITYGKITGNQLNTYKPGTKVYFQCNPGYESVKTYILCNREGKWDTEQPCKIKKGACVEISLENGFIYNFKPGDLTNQISQSVSYSCETGYKACDSTWWGVITCVRGEWDHKPLCIETNNCGPPPNIKHLNDPQEEYQNGSQVEYECDLGYVSYIKCINGAWQIPVCKSCGPPHHIENAVITAYTHRAATYKCQDLFEMEGNYTIFCNSSRWEKPPTCHLSSSACEKPPKNINNGVKKEIDIDKLYYKEGDTVSYKCSDGYAFKDVTSATCVGKNWTYPICLLPTCPDPVEKINNGFLIDSNEKKKEYTKDDTVKYKCKEGSDYREAICNGTNWLYPECISLVASGGLCGGQSMTVIV